MKRSEQKRMAIINAAKEEFIQHGFLAANMDKISEMAEVSKRTLYRHFDSKEALFETILTVIQQSIDDTVRYPFNAELSLQKQLVEITRNEADILYNTYGISLSRTIIMEFLRQPDQARSLINKLYGTKAVTQWFYTAKAAGKLRKLDPATMTTAFLSLFQGVLFWPQVFDLEPIPEGDILEEKIDLVVTMLLGAAVGNDGYS